MMRVRIMNRLAGLALLCCPLITGAELSVYRGFQLGMSVSAAVKHSGMDPSEVTNLHRRPARVDQLDWRPGRFSSSSAPSDPVEQVQFSFYNGQLFRMVVDYDARNTEGMSVADMIQALSQAYGTPTSPLVDVSLSSDSFSESMKVLARWEDADCSVNLVQAPYGPQFELISFSKRLDGLAQAAVAGEILLDNQEAPTREKTQEQEVQVKLDKARVTNRLNFRP